MSVLTLTYLKTHIIIVDKISFKYHNRLSLFKINAIFNIKACQE